MDWGMLVTGLAVGAATAAIAVWTMLRNGVRESAAACAAARQELATWQERCEGADRRVQEMRTALATRDERIQTLNDELRAAAGKAASLEERLSGEQRLANEKLGLLNDARQRLTEAFGELSKRALQEHTEVLRKTAREDVITPIRESLVKVDEQIRALETARAGAYEGLKQQVLALTENTKQLASEANGLRDALRNPRVRGRWGEIQLRRVVELAGMQKYCDFDEQVSIEGEDGRLRPDLVVRLPNERLVIVDAKAPLENYLEALETTDEAQRVERLAQYARLVRSHIGKLGQKAYQSRLPGTPEFTILFLPGESFFAAAIEQDGGLLEAGAEQNVLVATPTTLIALLRAVASGWREQQLAENARKICDLGKELHQRLTTWSGHLARLGKSLGGSVDAYNDAVGSLEARVLVSARRFRELQAAAGEEIAELPQVEQSVRTMAVEQLYLPEEMTTPPAPRPD